MGVQAAFAALSVGLGVQQQREQRKATKEQQKAQEAQQAAANARAQRERIQQIRRQRAAQAQIQAAGFAAGAPTSSSVQGGVSGVGSQAASNIGLLNTQQAASSVASAANQRALDFQSRAATLGVASSIFGNQGFQEGTENAIEKINTIFR